MFRIFKKMKKLENIWMSQLIMDTNFISDPLGQAILLYDVLVQRLDGNGASRAVSLEDGPKGSLSNLGNYCVILKIR